MLVEWHQNMSLIDWMSLLVTLKSDVGLLSWLRFEFCSTRTLRDTARRNVVNFILHWVRHVMHRVVRVLSTVDNLIYDRRLYPSTFLRD
jgi:hypothetical protein